MHAERTSTPRLRRVRYPRQAACMRATANAATAEESA